MKPQVFVDGQEGTTGLVLLDLLKDRTDIDVMEVDPTRRKDPDYKRSRYEGADLVVLCLPDDAAREAVTLSNSTRFLDASTAHRVSEGWEYGLPELTPASRSRIREAQRVSNPGCYPTGFLLAIAPLVASGSVSPQAHLQAHAVSGYSGGGKKLIARYEDTGEHLMDTRPYALGLQHKHLPEMQCHANLTHMPFFLPSVGPFYRGMIVSVAISNVDRTTVLHDWTARYSEEVFVHIYEDDAVNGVVPATEDGFLSAMRCNDTNRVDLIASGEGDHTLVCAVLDNLGKGAAHAAVQNINLMLGIEETTGLQA